MLLENYNNWSIVTRDETKQAIPTVSVQDWEHRETKAKVLLWMFVKDNIVFHIRDWATSQATWETLKKFYETMNINKVLLFKKSSFSIRLEVKESITDFLSRIKEISDKLGIVGENISNTNLVTNTSNTNVVTNTLNGISNDCLMFIFGHSVREKYPTLHELTCILLQEEARRKNLNARS